MIFPRRCLVVLWRRTRHCPTATMEAEEATGARMDRVVVTGEEEVAAAAEEVDTAVEGA